MVVGSPKLFLTTDLPYKKRQRPFNPNTPLQQATIRYNEALRKQYNDTQFSKRYENGYIAQNDLVSVNTVDIGRTVENDLFREMNNLNPLPVVRQRKSRKIFICAGNSSGEMPASLCHSSRYYSSQSSPGMETIEGGGEANSMNMIQPVPMAQASGEREGVQIDCNNTEMFPHLLSTVGNGSVSGSLSAHGQSSSFHSEKGSAPFLNRCLNKCPSTSSMSLETQAINQYEPQMDSAHDMIFGNVMGLDYGNYHHGHLWPTPQQSCSNENSLGSGNLCQHFSSQPNHPTFLHPHHPNICGASKSVGFNLPMSVHHHQYHTENHIDYDSGMITVSPLTNLGNHSAQYPGASRRSTSVPRPRTGTRKETLKQAAIRCGIIKGNQTVPAIPKRSHCLAPFQLAPVVPVQSDASLPVVEILHPRPLIPTCSSEALVDEDNRLTYISSLRNSTKVGRAEAEDAVVGNDHDGGPNNKTVPLPTEIPSEGGKALAQNRSVEETTDITANVDSLTSLNTKIRVIECCKRTN